MQREKKTTLALAENGQTGSPVRNPASCQRPFVRNGGVTRAVAPLLGFILVTLICPTPALASAFSASGKVGQEFYAAGPPGHTSSGPTGATFTQEYRSGGIFLSSSAEASSGVLALLAVASMANMTNWDSGHISSSATAHSIESVRPAWQLLIGSGESFIFNYAIGVSGGMTTTIEGYGAVGSEASLAYNYQVGDSSGSGQWSQNAAGQSSKYGTWNNTIHNAFTVHRGLTYNLDLHATAAAFGTKNYSPGGNATIIALADFGHTLTWLGITGVQAFDSQGNEVPLPPDFYLPLMGQDSGFDYWNSAAAPESVPEPATWLLLGSGLVVAGLIKKSAARRKDS
ncbi:MAG: PEP-CTERM sorting domain-containing protein [Bryobacterales bacterium]|nr:PEP-CTERM sorting domain-containing protein [Bryobacterales bacterium]